MQIFNGVFFKVNKATMNMLHRVEPYVTYMGMYLSISLLFFLKSYPIKSFELADIIPFECIYIANIYRNPNLKSEQELIYKRGYGKLYKQRTVLTDNSIMEQVCIFLSMYFFFIF